MYVQLHGKMSMTLDDYEYKPAYYAPLCIVRGVNIGVGNGGGQGGTCPQIRNFFWGGGALPIIM